MTFPEAVAYLTGGPTPTRPGKAPGRPVAKPKPVPPPEPSGLPEADALALVADAAARLWRPEGADALAYLTGPRRCLSLETIRAARLGWTPGVMVPTRDGDRSFRALGVVIPWFDGDRLALVKIRQPDGRRPKYAEAFRDPARVVCYPSPETIRPGRPLVMPEGEFDALALGEALGELAAVVTLGSASVQPDRRHPGPDAGRRAVVRRDRCRPGRGQGRRRLARPSAGASGRPARSRIGPRPRPPGWTWPGGGATSWPASTGPRCSRGTSWPAGAGVARTRPPASTTPAAGRPWPRSGRGPPPNRRRNHEATSRPRSSAVQVDLAR